MRYVSDNEEKNLLCVAVLPIADNVYGYHTAQFIRDNNLLGKYLESQDPLLKKVDYGHYCGSTHFIKDWINMEEIQIDDQTYYRTTNKARRHKVEFYYKEVPGIFDDKILKWTNNGRYDAKESTFTQGMFEFHCIVKATGDAVVEVKYAKCENKHRNRVTIAEVEVIDATNKSIMEAVDKWKKAFLKDVESIQKAA